MNRVFLVGYLSKNPESRQTQKGLDQSNFSIGVNDLKRWEDSYFFNCVAWGQVAKYINDNIVKGQLVTIDGRLTQRSYTNNEGKNVNITEIIVDNIKTLGSNKKNSLEHNNTNFYPKEKDHIVTKTLSVDDIFEEEDSLGLDDWNTDIEEEEK